MILCNNKRPIRSIITPEICMESDEIEMYQYGVIDNKKNGFNNNVLGESKTVPYMVSNLLPNLRKFRACDIVEATRMSRDDIISLAMLLGYDDVYIDGETIVAI